MDKIKMIPIVIITLLFVMVCSHISCKNISKNKQDTIQSKQMKFKVVIVNFYFGRKEYVTTVTQDSLVILKDDMNGKLTRESRALTEKEIETLTEFLAEFPLSELKQQYVSETVEDGTVINFSITIDDQHKDIYIANIFQEDLGALVKVVVKMLKEDYIGYNQSSVPYKE